MTDYPFRLLCKACNSYRFTAIVRQGEHIRMECLRCLNHVVVTEERFDNPPPKDKKK